jgi:hypothetical protein
MQTYYKFALEYLLGYLDIGLVQFATFVAG